ncbi:hypothetical protein, partial [Enterobacter cloacae complex sp. 2DZ2F20B]|uniref:hypothetical protein n=1 Tax=Enterobacter cloacae complex sp. 2DZ2F20B TaxID=2511993 RepID=UPI001CA555A9
MRKVRHIVDGVVGHLALSHAQVVLGVHGGGALRLGRQVRLPVNGGLVHLGGGRQVLALGRVRFGPRRLDVLAF